MNAVARNSHSHQGIRTELRRTGECQRIRAQLTALEDNFFGPDFAWSPESVEIWQRSDSMFCTAVCQQASAQDLRIAAFASVLLTGSRSCRHLLRGEILESQLVPWFLDSPDSPPVLYFSSVISDTTEHLLSLYGNLLMEVESYLRANQLQVYTGLSIATGTAGFNHLRKNGFLRMEGPKYLRQYDFMRINAASAKTEFWRGLLSPSHCHRDSPREVEARLRLSKTERYRDFYSSEMPARA